LQSHSLEQLRDLGRNVPGDLQAIAVHAKDAGRLTRNLRNFVNRGLRSSGTGADFTPLTGPSARIGRMAQLYMEVLYTMAEFITEDILDLKKLEGIRLAMSEMEMIAASLEGDAAAYRAGETRISEFPANAYTAPSGP
jgi:hypothetical protein